MTVVVEDQDTDPQRRCKDARPSPQGGTPPKSGVGPVARLCRRLCRKSSRPRRGKVWAWQSQADEPSPPFSRCSSKSSNATPTTSPKVESQRSTTSSGASNNRPSATDSGSPPKRSRSAPGRLRWSTFPWGRGKTNKDVSTPRISLMDVLQTRLEQTRNDPFDVRQRIFRELQRELHPDKNLDRAEEAKTAFQQLMEQKASYLGAPILA